MNRRMFIISLIIFIKVLGVGLILLLLTFFADQLGASPLVIGLFLSTLPFFAMLSGPLLGVLSDRYGSKPILLISIAGTATGFLLLGMARSIPMLFLARMMDGSHATSVDHGQPVAQTLSLFHKMADHQDRDSPRADIQNVLPDAAERFRVEPGSQLVDLKNRIARLRG